MIREFIFPLFFNLPVFYSPSEVNKDGKIKFIKKEKFN